jgi:4-hydroxy-tetrahydrodipicolinate synthase
MFTGLSAFPLTPMNEHHLDEAAFVRLVERLVDAGVDSIGALGSTGSYAYLSREERKRIAALAVQNAGDIPVMVGIGAMRTRDVLALADDAQTVGASAVLLAPVSYQQLTQDEVFGLFDTVTRHLSIPLCVYDNPGTTRFVFTDELHARIAQLPHVRSIKIPGISGDSAAAAARVQSLKSRVPDGISIGISGDSSAALGLSAGCQVWYSVIGGLFPKTALAITRAAQAGHADEAAKLSDRLSPLWALFQQCNGSSRVVAAAAEILGLVQAPSLPLPLQSLQGDLRVRLAEVLDELKLD